MFVGEAGCLPYSGAPEIISMVIMSKVVRSKVIISKVIVCKVIISTVKVTNLEAIKNDNHFGILEINSNSCWTIS